MSQADDMDRKATIVLEHLIQASDVSHTMQHWDIYLDWNERFFVECYRAFKTGRSASDPSEGWYKGEIGFFDFYSKYPLLVYRGNILSVKHAAQLSDVFHFAVIPLAKKLESCGVFGVSSHEYLAYAEANRNLWEQKGESIVQGYLERFQAMEEEEKLAKSEPTSLDDLELGLGGRGMVGEQFEDEISI